MFKSHFIKVFKTLIKLISYENPRVLNSFKNLLSSFRICKVFTYEYFNCKLALRILKVKIQPLYFYYNFNYLDMYKMKPILPLVGLIHEAGL